MLKIVAIGGGEIGRPGHPVETMPIDLEIIRLTGKTSPRLLFAANGDSPAYFETVRRHFGGRLGCRTDALYLTRDNPSFEEIEAQVLRSDVVYVGGGNTLHMLKAWRKAGLDSILRKAAERGIVLSGVSAGAICWFRWGSSDSTKAARPQAQLVRVSALGLIPALYCPHFDTGKDRRSNLKELMKRSPGVALGIDECCAVEIVDAEFRIIDSRPSANAYKTFWKSGGYHEELVPKRADFLPLESLLRK